MKKESSKIFGPSLNETNNLTLKDKKNREMNPTE
jgi:hypothetical protein